ncbi:aminoglycoside phosphotransferase family protein [Arthrobacter sp. SX1312]|uniref:aminoglycoside phosphotransferase family protein n=1 Tax=Arthrobacter sp. SX1312 TaxID=2058896 RepID=UPI000CE3F15E|nr:aminoglycoside phosphotransferase family protein [Arthrobacter sp. SX1312]
MGSDAGAGTSGRSSAAGRLADLPDLPPALVHSARTIEGGARWTRSWHGLLAERLDAWNLDLDLRPGQAAWAGRCAVVVPVLQRTGGTPDAVLKLSIPHDEALPEPDALTLWDGTGAVRLLASSRPDYALLLQRLDGDHSLRDVPLDETPAPWGAVLRQLCVRPEGGASWAVFPHLASEAEQWTDTLPAQWDDLGEPFPRWLMEAALEVCQSRGVLGRRSERDVLVHSDLHYDNLLPSSPDRLGDFVAIDPKPVLGDAEYAVAPMLWNRLTELDPADPAGHLQAHCRALAAAAGLDAELARGWTVVREVRNALSYLAHGHEGDADRSLWVASSVLGRTLDGLPPVGALPSL